MGKIIGGPAPPIAGGQRGLGVRSADTEPRPVGAVEATPPDVPDGVELGVVGELEGPPLDSVEVGPVGLTGLIGSGGFGVPVLVGGEVGVVVGGEVVGEVGVVVGGLLVGVVVGGLLVGVVVGGLLVGEVVLDGRVGALRVERAVAAED